MRDFSSHLVETVWGRCWPRTSESPFVAGFVGLQRYHSVRFTYRPKRASGAPDGLLSAADQTSGETGSPLLSASFRAFRMGPPSRPPPSTLAREGGQSSSSVDHVVAKISWSRIAAPGPPWTASHSCPAAAEGWNPQPMLGSKGGSEGLSPAGPTAPPCEAWSA